MNSNWSYGPETAKLGFDLCNLDLWALTLTFCMDITSVSGNNSWKFHDERNIVKKVWQTDGRTDRRAEGQIEPFTELHGDVKPAHDVCKWEVIYRFWLLLSALEYILIADTENPELSQCQLCRYWRHMFYVSSNIFCTMTVNISKILRTVKSLMETHFSRQLNCWSLRWSSSIACRRCSNYIFILHLTLGFNISVAQRQLYAEI